MNQELSPHKFENTVRHDLRYHHRFEHKELEWASSIFNDTLTKLKKPQGLRAEHFPDALKEMREHANWERLSSAQRTAVELTLKKHLGIEEESEKAA